MIKILILILFLIGSIYNFKISRKNYVYVAKSNILTTALIVFAIITTYLCYRLDNTVLGYIIVVSALIYVISFSFTPGIRKNGINIMMGTTTLIKNIKFNDIKNINYKETNNNNFKIIINAYGNEYHQVYEMKDKSKVLELLEKLNK